MTERNNQLENILIIKLHIKGIGISKEISTSKIRKIKATKKKCIEKGKRENDFGSNPHSNTDDFSHNVFGLIDNKKFNTISNKEINANVKENIIKII